MLKKESTEYFLKFLAMLTQRPVFTAGMVNSTEFVVHFKTNFVKVVLQSVVVPATINAVGQLILQDPHVSYRKTETTLGISGINIHSIHFINI